MKLSELREYQLEFEKSRAFLKPGYEEINTRRKNFIRDYPIDSISALTKDQYVVGKGGSTFCNRIENELNEWGNIHGSSAIKFGLYFGKYGNDKTPKYRIGRKEYGQGVDEAFKTILDAIVGLLKNKENLELLKKSPISPMFKGKLLSVYYPNDFLNIYSANHLNHCINSLGLDNDSKSELEKQALLLSFKRNDAVMKSWSVYEFSKFLYFSFGSPSDEFKNDKVPKELRRFKFKDFPPIESLRPRYVDLKTEQWHDQNKNTKNANSKPDYDTQSRRFKQIGDRGEQIVLRAEKQYLTKCGKKDLAELVDHVAKKDDRAGYDIVSFERDGQKRFIEVKSTTREKGLANIYISANEWAIAFKEENYYFYIVYEVDTKTPKIWRIKGPDLLNDINIVKEPILYSLKINTK